MGRLIQSVAGQKEVSVPDFVGNHNVIFGTYLSREQAGGVSSGRDPISRRKAE